MRLFCNTRDFAIDNKVKEINKQIKEAVTVQEHKAARERAGKMVKCFMRMDKALAQALAV
jgi:ferritin